MHFKKPTGNEQQLIQAFVPDSPAVVQRKMFGYPAAFVNGKMFICTYDGSLVHKLSERDAASFKKEFEAEDFSPMPGRAMKGFVVVPLDLLENESVLHEWVQKAFHFVSTNNKK